MAGFFNANILDFTNIIRLKKLLVLLVALALVSCGAPSRLPQDVDLEGSKAIVEDRILAPLQKDNSTRAQLPELTPRRQLLQLRYHESSLANPDFIATLTRLSKIYSKDEATELPSETISPAVITTEDSQSSIISDAEQSRIRSIREAKRADIIIREGLKLEQELFTKLREIDDTFKTAGQELETTLFTQLNQNQTRLSELEDKRIPGVNETPPGQIFGRNLTRDADGYFALPPDLALIGSGNDGAVPSKIGALRGQVDNPITRISFAGLPLADALSFISASADMPVLISTQIKDSSLRLSLNIEARVLSILDAVLNQYNLSIIYDPDLEVAQFYSDAEFKERIDYVRLAVETYNTGLHDKREIARLKHEQALLNDLIDVIRNIIYDYETAIAASYSYQEVDDLIAQIPSDDETTFSKPLAEKRILETLQSDRLRLLDMIDMVQSLLSGDSQDFFDAVDSMPRYPGGADITQALSNLTLRRLSMAEALGKFDQETERVLAAPLIATIGLQAPQKDPLVPSPYLSVASISGFANAAVSDPCIYHGREVFTEKIAVYGGENAITRIQGILDSYFTANGSSFTIDGEDDADSEAEAEDTAPLPEGESEPSSISTETEIDISANALLAELNAGNGEGFQGERPNGCGDDPAANSPNFVSATDFSGFVVSGLISDIELFVRLVEEFDRPQRQVLVEVFMINVVKDFGRRLDLSFNTDSLATTVEDTEGFFLRRDLNSLSNSVTSSGNNGFVSGLISPNLKVQALVDFIETNDLGRTISSPTILVEEGSSAYVTRTNTKPVTRTTQSTVLDSNNNSVSVPSSTTQDETVSFRLDVSDVKINPNNNNVTLDFTLTDQAFETSLAQVTATTGKIEDEIRTKFVAAPGDVIVLAGLFKQIDSAKSAGLPGTTTTNLPAAFLLGGEDSVGNKIEEMIILMAPTVIEPEIGKNQPNSAFNRAIGGRSDGDER